MMESILGLQNVLKKLKIEAIIGLKLSHDDI